MKLQVAVLIAVLTNLASSEAQKPSHSCDKPPDRRLTEDCCILPDKFSFEIISGCLRGCYKKTKEVVENDNCVASCFISITNVVVEGKISKTIVKSLYKDEMNLTHHIPGLKFIDSAVDRCDYDETSPNAGENLAKFYACVERNLRENCYYFMPKFECLPVAEYFENCKHVVSCETWPETLPLPVACCNVPSMTPLAVHSDCHSKCYNKFFTDITAWHCLENCTVFDTKLIVDGKFDFEVAKKLLIESADNEKWNVAIEKAIESCRESFKTVIMNDIQFYLERLYACIQRALASYCVDFYDRWECKRTQSFMQKCPNLLID